MTSEILTRCGVGELALFDYDTLEEANLNRLVYKTRQIGMPKVEAIREHLQEANPDVDLTTYPYDVTDGKGYDALLKEVKASDLVLGCVDSFAVRMFLSARCVMARTPLIDGGVSEDGINGSVQVILPGKTPCYRCNRPLASEAPSRPKRRDDSGLCHFTSLPTTMGIIASLQAQESLKHLLKFGRLAPLILYFGMEGRLERVDWKRDPACPVCGRGRR